MMTGKNEGSVKVRKKYFFNKHYAHLKIYKYMSLSAYVQIKFFTKISWAMALMSLFLEKKKRGTENAKKQRMSDAKKYAQEIGNHNEKNVTLIHLQESYFCLHEF